MSSVDLGGSQFLAKVDAGTGTGADADAEAKYPNNILHIPSIFRLQNERAHNQ